MGASRKVPEAGKAGKMDAIKGAGQTMLGSGPGSAARRVMGGKAEPNNNNPTPSGKPPKGMKIEYEGE